MVGSDCECSPYLYGAPFIFIELQATFNMTLTPFQADLCNHELVSVFCQTTQFAKITPKENVAFMCCCKMKQKKNRGGAYTFSSFPCFFFSICVCLKSPLGEPHLCCQATRLSGSRALMNRLSVIAVALPTHLTQTQTGGRTYAHVQTVWHAYSLSCQDANTLT